MFLLGFRRKLTALALCKSIESAIQWFQIHHRITFATIQNPAVYLSGARVSIFFTLVPRLYQDNIKSDIKLQYESRVNVLKSYCKVCYLFECLGYIAFVLEFYIAFDSILICLPGDCSINKLKLRDPIKSYEIVPSIRLQWILTHPSM